MAGSRKSILNIVSALCLSAVLWAGCAMVPKPTLSGRVDETGALGSCADFFASLDELTGEAGVLDPGAFRVDNYPYLRVDRFMASFGGEVDEPAAFAAWVDWMQALDQEARRYEIANLPDLRVATLDPLKGRAGLDERVAACGDLLKKADFRDIEHRQQLRRRVAAPDEYILLRRILGIYPLTGLFVSRGVSEWHAAVRKSFSIEPPVGWQTIRYIPEAKGDRAAVHRILSRGRRDALGIPVYSTEERDALLRWYAPLWEIQIGGKADRIGRPNWTDRGGLDVDTRQPLTYTLMSFTRFGKRILTQLNYIVWFPSRPKQGGLDLYGGLLDGLNYRVTLDVDGNPLLYETVHNCGCYYKAYPSRRLTVRSQTGYAEPPLVLGAPEMVPSLEFMAVAMESRTHYVQHLYPVAREPSPESETYAFADYARLRSLPFSDTGRRSMFDRYALAPGSERLERFLLWPMGVVSPGGMRQWGRHAVAFVGRRHFDDPFYMDRMFFRTEADGRP